MPDPLFGYRLEGPTPTFVPYYMGGIVQHDGSVTPVAGGYLAGGSVTPPPATTRDPFLHPFASDAPFNLGVATTAQFEADTSPRNAHWITKGNAAPGGGIAQVNDQATEYSVAVVKATTSDPVVTLRHPSTGTAYSGVSGVIRIPTNTRPPSGLDHNTVVVQPDGTAHDLYKLVKQSDTSWTSTSVEAINLLGSGIVRGIRAANISLLNGLIRRWEIQAVLDGTRTDFGHALAISIPEDALGPPSPGYIWPANARDQSAIVYSGPIPMGSFGAIPQAQNAAAAVTGLMAKATANTLTKYGAYIIDRSSTYALYVEPMSDGSAAPSWLTNAASEMKAAWRDQLMKRFRFVSNSAASTPGGGALGSERLAPAAPPLA